MITSDNLHIKNPLVSVLIITYNQEKTIAQTIESVLMQKGDFSLEIIVAEDAGSDSTANICLEYQKKYPDEITLLMQDKNKGIVGNFIDGIRLCRGIYIGVCAGDDYWCDEYKLKKQLEFFNKNPDYGFVSTGGYRLLVKKNKLVEGIAPLMPVTDGNAFDKTWRGGVYAMPLSVLFRSELLRFVDFDEFLKRDFSVEDVPLQAILAHNTKFGHIPDACVVYRVYNTSQTFVNLSRPSYLTYHKGLVNIRRYLHELYPDEVEFSETWASDYLTYRRFLQAVYHFDYSKSKDEIAKIIKDGQKEKRVKRYLKTRIGFCLFALAKRVKIKLYNKV